jgi:hypothetical protein
LAVAQPETLWPAAVSERSTALVSREPRPARVVAAFPSALYLLVDVDTGGLSHRPVLPVVAHGGLRLPTAVTLATEVPGGDWGVQPGETVVVGDGRIHLPGAVVAGVRTWRPRRTPTATAGLPASAVAVLADLPQGSLRDAADALVAELVSGRDATARVAALVGAGPGLTPSGDDALCGILLSLRLAGPRAVLHAAALWEAVRLRLPATSSLSASLLAEAAQGYAVPPVVQLGEALVAGAPARVLARIAEVAAIGHSSGEDLLAGMAGCLDAVLAELTDTTDTTDTADTHTADTHTSDTHTSDTTDPADTLVRSTL